MLEIRMFFFHKLKSPEQPQRESLQIRGTVMPEKLRIKWWSAFFFWCYLVHVWYFPFRCGEKWTSFVRQPWVNEAACSSREVWSFLKLSASSWQRKSVKEVHQSSCPKSLWSTLSPVTLCDCCWDWTKMTGYPKEERSSCPSNVHTNYPLHPLFGCVRCISCFFYLEHCLLWTLARGLSWTFRKGEVCVQ